MDPSLPPEIRRFESSLFDKQWLSGRVPTERDNARRVRLSGACVLRRYLDEWRARLVMLPPKGRPRSGEARSAIPLFRLKLL